MENSWQCVHVNLSTNNAGHDPRTMGILTFSMPLVTSASKTYKTTFRCCYILMILTDSLATENVFENLKHASIITGC